MSNIFDATKHPRYSGYFGKKENPEYAIKLIRGANDKPELLPERFTGFLPAQIFCLGFYQFVEKYGMKEYKGISLKGFECLVIVMWSETEGWVEKNG